eukprot:TRINITY_DN68948_c0_g1_i1.p1 TRINITY_DN68948_c0_g1~~TRINITY_DN68948_c0_g1_i1.p1  ORF type:complete len:573 (-),score=117.62 TRINITY_DN68948_c0_g1_i1:71-1789(-)
MVHPGARVGSAAVQKKAKERNQQKINLEVNRRLNILEASDSSSSSCSSDTDTDAENLSLQARLREFAEGNRFQALVMTVIGLNVIAIALEVDYPEIDVDGVDVWFWANTAFLAFFTIEITIRFLSYGCRGFFCAKELDAKFWNYFDFFIVASGIVDTGSKLMPKEEGAKQSNFALLIRIVRLFRICRVVRIVKSLKQLQMLIRGLVESLGIVCWIALLMLVIILIFGIMCTQNIGQMASMWDGDDAAKIKGYFGSVPRSMQTLFEFLTLCDWSDIVRTVAKKQQYMVPIFIIYVVLSAFVVLSLLTGIMAEHMNSVREMEAEEQMKEIMLRVHDANRAFYKAFLRADKNGDHKLSKTEFMGLLLEEEVMKTFAEFQVKLGDEDKETFFAVTDMNNDGMISWEEFKRAFHQLREGDKSAKPIMIQRNRIQRQFPHGDGHTCTRPLTDRERLEAEASAEALDDRVYMAEVACQELGDSLTFLAKKFEMDVSTWDVLKSLGSKPRHHHHHHGNHRHMEQGKHRPGFQNIKRHISNHSHHTQQGNFVQVQVPLSHQLPTAPVQPNLVIQPQMRPWS